MADHQAKEIQATLDRLKQKREKLQKIMKEDQKNMEALDAQYEVLFTRVEKVNGRLLKREAAKKEYEKAIMETEANYMQLLERARVIIEAIEMEENANDEIMGEIVEAAEDNDPTSIPA